MIWNLILLVRISPCPYLRNTLATICRLGPNVSFRVGAGMPPGLGCCTQPCKTGAACLRSHSLLKAHAHQGFMFTLSWMHFRISENYNKGTVASSIPVDPQCFQTFVDIFLHYCLLTWDFDIRHTEYLLWTLGIVELHRKTGQEFPLPEQFQSLECDGTPRECCVSFIHTFQFSSHDVHVYTNIHILMYVHKYMYAYIIYTHIYNYSEPFEKKNIMLFALW